MIKFALKSLIFVLPFLILITIEVIIDPFNYFSQENNIKLQERKEDISLNTNPYLYKLIKYDRNPSSIIILGDSRMDLLHTSEFEADSKEKVSNLSIGGGTVQDAIEILRYISEKHDIKKIYWGISIESYSGTRLRNRATPSIEIKNSLLLYLLNRYTFSATMLICREIIFNEQIELSKPPVSREVFWQDQLDLCSRYLGNYTYPENYFNDLKKISADCKAKNIKLVFVLPPTQLDLQKKIHEFQLDEEDKQLKADLESFGDLFDFNYPNDITTNKDNYKDPFHFKDSISNIIIREISTNQIKYSKFTPINK
jgi:hypothetical protein